MEFVLIPPGEFLLGSPKTEERRRDHEQQRRVVISRPFYMATTEVTQQQWHSIMETTPWKGKRFVREDDDYAATYVNWKDATKFCRRFSEQDSQTYRLPTEAEWEYACRAGTNTAYSFGDDASLMSEHGWIGNNTFDVDRKYAQLVGRKKPNPFGLYDMHGNNWEWCADWYSEPDAEIVSEKAIVDPRGPKDGTQRVIRGGSWHGLATLCRSASRFKRRPEMGGNDVGFRIVLAVEK